MTPSPLDLDFIGMATNEVITGDTSGYGVLDLGATETVGSLEALEKLMWQRHQAQGWEEGIKVFTGPNAVKPFRFGNGGIKYSESFALVPQKLGENSVMLGMFTLDAEKVPILIGMRTLDRLGAVIDVSGRWMVLSNVAPDLKIPLGKSKAGHLLVDLRTDWLTMGQPLEQHAPRPRAAYKVSSPLCAVSPMDHEDVTSQASHDMLDHLHPELCMSFESPHTLEQALVVEKCSEAEGLESGEDLEAAYMLDRHDHLRRPLAQADQGMRDDILTALVNDASRAHGAQGEGEEEACGTSFRAVRLQPHTGDQQGRSPGHGTTMPWRTHSCDAGTRLEHRQQRPCNMGGMLGV